MAQQHYAVPPGYPRTRFPGSSTLPGSTACLGLLPRARPEVGSGFKSWQQTRPASGSAVGPPAGSCPPESFVGALTSAGILPFQAIRPSGAAGRTFLMAAHAPYYKRRAASLKLLVPPLRRVQAEREGSGDRFNGSL